MLHNRWVSPSSPYYNESDPAYDPEAYGSFAWAPFDPAAGDTVVLPIDAAFFTTLMAPAAAWGMVTYEQDFLTAQYETVAAKQLGVEDAHLDAMHAAAASLNVTIQCVGPARARNGCSCVLGFSPAQRGGGDEAISTHTHTHTF